MKQLFSFLCLLVLLFPQDILAQEKKLDFFGSGRFALNNSNISGELLRYDTTTAQKQMTGYTLFDLGFHIRPSEETEIKAITRVTNDINGFWGGGINFYLRELYLRGLLFKRIKYQVGDLNTKMTPYTLYNSSIELSAHNPIALNTVSEVINYDKFYGTNSWRQQGASADFGFDFEKYLNHLHVSGLITKNRQTDYFSTPDRLLSGLTLQAKAFHQLRLTYNQTNVFDVQHSAMFSLAQFKNQVQTFGLSEQLLLSKINMGINAEMGRSSVSYTEIANAPVIPNGTFLDAGFDVQNKQKSWLAAASFRSVETSFRSMGAQSRRVDFSKTGLEYPYYTNREIPRPANMLDVISDGSYYNMFLSPDLKAYNPAYENMLPYGKATPNRQGGDVSLMYKPNKSFFKLGVDAALYNEITGQGTTSLRQFTNAEAYADMALNELYKGKKKLQMSLYVRSQNTARAGLQGIDKIDLKTTQFKLGVSFEVVPKLELQIAGILLKADGNEYLAQRNSYNEIIFYKGYTAQLNEALWIGGINYQFSKNNCLKIQYQQSNWDNLLLPDNQYKINRFSVLYNLFF